MAKTKTVTKKDQSQELIPGIDFTADAGGGLEATDHESFAIPFLRVVQKMSPAIDDVPGAKPGHLINTVTGELFESVTFVPCAFRRSFIAWAPRGDGVGYRGEYTPEEVAEMRSDGRARDVEGEGLLMGEERLVDTRSHYGLLLTEKGPQQVVLALSSTQIKKSKQLMSILSAVQIRGATPPTWVNKIRITTVQEKNDQGSWHGVRFEPEGFITDQSFYETGKAFHDTVMAGEVKAAYEKSSNPDEGGF